MFERIERNDEATLHELQQLLERCSDYYELHEGRGTPPTAAADEWDTVPSEFAREKIYVLGFREGGRLIAEMSLVRAYPEPEEWWMALFVVDPDFRSRGHGRRICEEAFEWCASLGGTTMVIAVDDENVRGEKFWRALGFVETRRADYKRRRVIIMRRPLTVES